MTVKLFDGNEEVANYDVALLFNQSEQDEVVLQLKTPKIYDKPEKMLYRMEVYSDESVLVATYDRVLFSNYSITIDEANVEGISVPLRFVNNSFRFKVL